jgi:hypothetical protein
MDTPRSAESAQAWTAGASVFSGRPDPEWTLSEAGGARLEALWSALEPLAGEAPAPPPLGYRGCWAQAPGGARRFTAYRGAVTRADPSKATLEVRGDPARAFERLVLQSAPHPGVSDEVLALAGLDPPRR